MRAAVISRCPATRACFGALGCRRARCQDSTATSPNTASTQPCHNTGPGVICLCSHMLSHFFKAFPWIIAQGGGQELDYRAEQQRWWASSLETATRFELIVLVTPTGIWCDSFKLNHRVFIQSTDSCLSMVFSLTFSSLEASQRAACVTNVCLRPPDAEQKKKRKWFTASVIVASTCRSLGDKSGLLFHTSFFRSSNEPQFKETKLNWQSESGAAFYSPNWRRNKDALRTRGVDVDSPQTNKKSKTLNEIGSHVNLIFLLFVHILTRALLFQLRGDAYFWKNFRTDI